MGLEWVVSYYLVALSAGLYCIGWIVYMDRIVSAGLAGLDWLDWIGSYRIGWMRTHWIVCIGWLLLEWDGWTGWGVGGTGVGRTDVSAFRNGRAVTGAPPLALKGSRCAGWLLPTWDGWTGWGVGGAGVR